MSTIQETYTCNLESKKRLSEPTDPNKPTNDQGLKNQSMTSSEHPISESWFASSPAHRFLGKLKHKEYDYDDVKYE